MIEEHVDILDDKGEKTGETTSLREAHATGVVHRAIHVWILSPDKKLLLQKRSEKKVSYPNHWDISVGGHVSAGQSSLEAAQRETQEELGLAIPIDKFEYLFSLEEHIVLNNGTYINNEFQDVYLVRLDHTDIDLSVADGEVSEVKWVSLDEFESLLKSSEILLVPHEEEYSRILELVK